MPIMAGDGGGLRTMVRNRPAHQGVFLNRDEEPLTRYGIHILLSATHVKLSAKRPPCAINEWTPLYSHSTAMALLHSGVDINTIRIWLGHASLQTTHIYAECDLK